MRKYKVFVATLLAMLMAGSLCACSTEQHTDAIAESAEDDTTVIKMENDTFSVEGAGADVENNVVTISQAGTYIIGGTISDGQIMVNSKQEGRVWLVLKGADISCQNSAPIYIKNAEEVVLTLAEGTQNYLSDGESYVYESTEETEPDAALFSKADLAINGSGTLTITGNYSHAIKAKDTLAIAEATLVLTSVADAVNAKDELRIESGSYTIHAGDDALHSDGLLTINGGNIQIEACEEGIEGSSIAINNGEMAVTSRDDGMNAAGDEEGVTHEITISGGKITLNTSGDGIDSNGAVYLKGGEVFVYGPTNDGNGSLDYDSEFVVSGGSMILAGSSGMAQSASDSSSQNCLMVAFASQQAAGSTYSITDDAGNVLIEIAPTTTYSCVFYTDKDLEQGVLYHIHVNGTEVTTVTLAQTITSISDSGEAITVTGMMGGNGMRGEKGQMPQGERPQMPEGETPPEMPRDIQ